jgi:hypothetical protein
LRYLLAAGQARRIISTLDTTPACPTIAGRSQPVPAASATEA